jgi:hypothetical protein
MKRLFSFFAVLFAVILLSGNSFAQQWTSEQKDVWASEIKNWNDFQSGNLDAFMSYFDENSRDWDFGDNAPQNKADMGKGMKAFYDSSSVVYYTLTPITIWVNDNYAYAQYYYTMLTKDKITGKQQANQGNWTDILLKENGKWMLVGDRGGRTSKPE